MTNLDSANLPKTSGPIPGIGPIVFAVSAAALAGLLFGYDTGVASGVQGYLQSYFHLSNGWLGFAIACLELGCVPGAMFAGTLADRYGRKNILIVCAVLFAISGILSAIPQVFFEFSRQAAKPLLYLLRLSEHIIRSVPKKIN